MLLAYTIMAQVSVKMEA